MRHEVEAAADSTRIMIRSPYLLSGLEDGHGETARSTGCTLNEWESTTRSGEVGLANSQAADGDSVVMIGEVARSEVRGATPKGASGGINPRP